MAVRGILISVCGDASRVGIEFESSFVKEESLFEFTGKNFIVWDGELCHGCRFAP